MRLRIECVTGDIAWQPDIDAVVNAANARLMTGGGVAGAIHRAAGLELARECEPLAPIRPGEAVITGGHKLPNRWVIHCLGPVYGVGQPGDILLWVAQSAPSDWNSLSRSAVPVARMRSSHAW